MDQSGFDIAGDLPQRSGRSQALVQRISQALPNRTFAAARRAVARLAGERLRESYFTTFWLPRGAPPRHALEEAVRALEARAGVRCAGTEWWIGRAYTTDLPIEFHFDHDVHGGRTRYPLRSSVLFFNRVRGGQLAVTDQTPRMRAATRMEAVKPEPNLYVLFDGNLLHGVLDAHGRTPTRRLPGPRGRLRMTLVVNYWARRPTGVPTWEESGLYRSLAR